MKKIAIIQSNYLPWKGYFDIVAAADEFILYDDMQFTKNDWRNRNKIKTPQGLSWLTVPVGQSISQRIRDVALCNAHWQTKHWKTLQGNYARAPYFDEIATWLAPIFLVQKHSSLSELNRTLIEAVCQYLGIDTRISNSWDYDLPEGKTDRLISLCQQAGAQMYISGPAARDYIDEALFHAAGIQLTWANYDGYPEYPQLWGDFVHGVSILDLLFNCGRSAPQYMKFGIHS